MYLGSGDKGTPFDSVNIKVVQFKGKYLVDAKVGV